MAAIMTSGDETSLQFKIARKPNIITNKISVAEYAAMLYTRDLMNSLDRSTLTGW